MTSAPTIRVAIIGDKHEGHDPSILIAEALKHSAGQLGIKVDAQMIPTSTLEQGAAKILTGFHGLWASSGKYERHDLGLEAITYARTKLVPFIGTCAGFQYAVLEFARAHLRDDTLEHPYHVSQQDPNLIEIQLACVRPPSC